MTKETTLNIDDKAGVSETGRLYPGYDMNSDESISIRT